MHLVMCVEQKIGVLEGAHSALQSLYSEQLMALHAKERTQARHFLQTCRWLFVPPQSFQRHVSQLWRVVMQVRVQKLGTAYLLFADTLYRRVSAESPQGLLGKGPQTVIRSDECGRALRPPVLSILHHSSLWVDHQCYVYMLFQALRAQGVVPADGSQREQVLYEGRWRDPHLYLRL